MDQSSIWCWLCAAGDSFFAGVLVGVDLFSKDNERPCSPKGSRGIFLGWFLLVYPYMENCGAEGISVQAGMHSGKGSGGLFLLLVILSSIQPCFT